MFRADFELCFLFLEINSFFLCFGLQAYFILPSA
eukprot:UN13132